MSSRQTPTGRRASDPTCTKPATDGVKTSVRPSAETAKSTNRARATDAPSDTDAGARRVVSVWGESAASSWLPSQTPSAFGSHGGGQRVKDVQAPNSQHPSTTANQRAGAAAASGDTVAAAQGWRAQLARMRDAWRRQPPDAIESGFGALPFEQEAQRTLSARGARRSQRIVRTAGVVVAALLVWAAFAKVDEVTRGDARVIPSRQLQVVQSLDGGVVSEILVREGQTVEAGQLLLRIDETRATSGVRESAAQGIALKARAARLRSFADGVAFAPPAATNDEERAVVEDERRLYESRRSEIDNALSIVRQQVTQRQNEHAEASARRSAAQRALDLAQQELNQTRPLLASGAVSQVDVLRLEREVSRNRGDIEQAAAQMARTTAAIGESQRKLQEVELAARNEARKELAEVTARMNALNEGAVALADKVDKAQVKSPVRGRVQRLMANTVGGVVTPGKDIVEIVPLDDALVLEARVAPRDIAFIRPQQDAIVKFTAYDFSIYGGLEAKVENISPDSTVDDKGNAYFLVRVRTTKSALADNLPIMPGMTAEVDVLTGRKTVLSYLLKPVLKVHANALRER